MDDIGWGDYPLYGDIGWGDYPLTETQQVNTLLAKDDAKTKGSFDWANLLDNVLKYGGKTLEVLSKAGIIKDKNKLALADVNQASLLAFLQANAGKNLATTTPDNLVVPTRSTDPQNPFGINTSTLLLAGGAGLLVWALTKKQYQNRIEKKQDNKDYRINLNQTKKWQ